MTQEPGTEAGERESSPAQRGMRWTSIMVLGTAAIVLPIIALELLVIQELVPPLVAVAVLSVVGLVLMRRTRAGVILLGVVGLVYLILLGPFVVEALAFPASTLDFVLNLVSVVGCVAVIVGAVALRSGQVSAASAAARNAAVGLLTIVVLGTAFSITVRLTREDPMGRPFDLTVTAEDTEFSPKELNAAALAPEAGEKLPPVAFFIQNEDLTAHTFTIDELGIDMAIPGGGSARTEVDEAAAGTYEYYCKITGHEDMKGNVVLEIQEEDV